MSVPSSTTDFRNHFSSGVEKISRALPASPDSMNVSPVDNAAELVALPAALRARSIGTTRDEYPHSTASGGPSRTMRPETRDAGDERSRIGGGSLVSTVIGTAANSGPDAALLVVACTTYSPACTLLN